MKNLFVIKKGLEIIPHHSPQNSNKTFKTEAKQSILKSNKN
jgi:hypothetical protein